MGARQFTFRPLLTLAVLLAGLLGAATTRADQPSPLSLVMYEQSGCVWCDRWHSEIGPIYPKTTEGQSAPLRTVDIHGAIPDDLSEISVPLFTPTFVLVQDGQELRRLEGYPGEDFFWGILGQMLAQAAQTRQDGSDG